MTESYSKLTFSNYGIAILCMLIGNALIGIGPFFVEFSGLDAFNICFYRMISGGIAFFAISLVKQEKFFFKNFWLYILAAFLITIDLLLFNQSILYIGPGLSTVLSNIEVFFLALIGAAFFGEKLNRSFFIMSLLVFAAIFLLIQPYFSEMNLNILLGVFFALSASFIFGLYLLILKTINQKNLEMSATSNLGIICTLGVAVLAVVISLNSSTFFSLPQTATGMTCIILYSLVSQVCGWWFVSKGITHLSLSTSGVLFLLQPFIAFLGDCIFLGRNTEMLQILGGLFLLIAIYITIRNQEKMKVIT